jgi:4-hydroxy-3-polyprenylbenzoate decarboxylase
MKKRLIVGISGASGTIYGVRLLAMLKSLGIESHLVVSRAAELTLSHEAGMNLRTLAAQADHLYPVADVGAAIASGSFQTMGMIVAPCSVRSMSEIATGVTSNLLTRAADVVLKERRRLVLLVRETPLHLGHLRRMVEVTEMGGIIMPPVPAFYAGIADLADMVDQTLGRALDLFNIEAPVTRRWGEDAQPIKKVKAGVVKKAVR